MAQFNGTEQKILSVIGTLTEPVSRTAIIKAAGIADGSNVTKALARLEDAALIASSRVGRSMLYQPVPADVAEEANFAAGDAEDAAAFFADDPNVDAVAHERAEHLREIADVADGDQDDFAADTLANMAVREGDSGAYDRIVGTEPDEQDTGDNDESADDPLTGDERAVLDHIGDGATRRTAVVAGAGFSGKRLNVALDGLRARGLIAFVPEGYARAVASPSPESESRPDAPADMSPRPLVGEIADDLLSGKNAYVIQAIHRVAGLSPEDRAAVRAIVIARMPAGDERATLIASAGLGPTADECRAAIEEGRKERAAKSGRKPKDSREKPLFNTTERYIVNTLAFTREAMTRKEIDQACKLRGGSIAGHAVKKAYVALVERGILARTGDGDGERFEITAMGFQRYAQTLDGKAVELLIVPRWVPPAKREVVATA